MKKSENALGKLYPFKSHFLQLGGEGPTREEQKEGEGRENELRYHYLDEGEGEAVLMLHGNPTWSFYYRNLVSGLRDHFRCLVPDHLGCGLSAKPQNYPYRLANHIQNAEYLIKGLDIQRFNLIVHDWGGPIGMGLAESMPDRVGKIVVFNTAAFLSPHLPLSLKLCRLPLIGSFFVRGLNAFARSATVFAVNSPMNPEVKRGYLYPYDNWADRIATLRFVEDIPMSPRHPTFAVMEKIEKGLSALQGKPMLICWGMRDFVFTENFLEEWLERFPKAEAHRFREAGHYVLEDAGEKILPLVEDFLTRRFPGAAEPQPK